MSTGLKTAEDGRRSWCSEQIAVRSTGFRGHGECTGSTDFVDRGRIGDFAGARLGRDRTWKDIHFLRPLFDGMADLALLVMNIFQFTRSRWVSIHIGPRVTGDFKNIIVGLNINRHRPSKRIQHSILRSGFIRLLRFTPIMETYLCSIYLVHKRNHYWTNTIDTWNR